MLSAQSSPSSRDQRNPPDPATRSTVDAGSVPSKGGMRSVTVESSVSVTGVKPITSALTSGLGELSVGSLLAALSGAVLLCSLLLTWFASGLPNSGLAGAFSGELASGGIASTGVSAFGVSVTLGVVLAICGAMPIALAVLPASLLPATVRESRTLFTSAAVALLAIVYMRINPPDLLAGGGIVNGLANIAGYGASPAFGIYLGLSAALGIATGGMLCESGPLAAGNSQESAGPLRQAIDRARSTGAALALSSLGLALATVLIGLFGFVADSYAMIGVAILGAIATIATARSARHHAQAAADQRLVYLTRFAQMSGWAILAAVGVLLLLTIIAVGQAVSQVAG